MKTHNSTVVWIIDGLAVIIRSPQPHDSGRIGGLHPFQVGEVRLICCQNVGEVAKVFRRYRPRFMRDGNAVLSTSLCRSADEKAM
jgi:hypothetical protein